MLMPENIKDNKEMTSFRSLLEQELKKLDSYQELRFWCIYAFRCMPFTSEELLLYTENTSYFAAFFSEVYSLYSTEHDFSANEIDIKKATFLNTTIKKIINNELFKLTSPLENTRAYIIDLINDFSISIESYYTYYSPPKRKIPFSFVVNDLRNKLIVYTPNHSETFKNILISDIKNIHAGEKLSSNIELYGDKWNKFIKTLNTLEYQYFSECIQRLFDNGFELNRKDKELISNVPNELYDKTSREVNAYIKSMLIGTKKLNEARLILLGNKGSGKTSLARRIVDPYAKMPNVEESTPGVDISNFKLKDISDEINDSENANVRVWDFAGHTITHAAHRCFLSERCIYIILCEGRKESTHSIDYWLELVRNYGGNSKVFIVVNMHDKNTVKADENRIKRDYSQNDCEFFYFSIKNDYTELLKFRIRLAEFISSTPSWSSNKIGLDWFNIKEGLEERFSNKSIDYISIDDYYNIADKVGVGVKEKDDALRALSALGVCLYYPQIDDLKTVVLDPEWITFGIYDIINWLGNCKKGYILYFNEFNIIFKDNSTKYPKEKHSFLYKLMLHYELAYEEREGVLVVPQCMATDEPEDLPEFIGDFLQLRFEAKNIDGCQIPFPPDLMPRLIINRCAEMNNKGSLAWRYGAVLVREKDRAILWQSGAVLNVKVSGPNASEFNYELYQSILTVIDNYDSFQKNKPIFSILPFLNNGKRGEITPVNTINNIAKTEQKFYKNPQDNQFLDMVKNAKAYGQIIFYKPVFYGETDFSAEIVVNEYEIHNLSLQGSLNDLLQSLSEESKYEDSIKDIIDLINALKEVETSQDPKKDGIRNGLVNKLKRFKDNLLNAESTFNSIIRGVKNGKTFLQAIIAAYNTISLVYDLPQIDLPDIPFLN